MKSEIAAIFTYPQYASFLAFSLFSYNGQMHDFTRIASASKGLTPSSILYAGILLLMLLEVVCLFTSSSINLNKLGSSVMVELRSGLNLFIKCVFVFFSFYYTVGAHLKTGNIKYFRACGNVSTYRDHSVVFMSDVLVMQRCSIF